MGFCSGLAVSDPGLVVSEPGLVVSEPRLVVSDLKKMVSDSRRIPLGPRALGTKGPGPRARDQGTRAQGPNDFSDPLNIFLSGIFSILVDPVFF